ncbi:YycH family regulatory protein [Thermobacillus xylanilyticus]|nr:two-component system activity regulator YycH [Thermobacillus xylanilyticus]
MMEKLKTALLIGLVILSLVQSYLLVYSFPEIGATVRTEQEYISPEQMGDPLRIDEVLYPEDMVLHMGGDRHAVLYPETSYYIRIYDQITAGEYRNFQRIPYAMRDWDELRRNTQGVELRYGGAMPVALLQKTMQIDGDILFLNDAIDRIWLIRRNFPGRSAAEIYFFSADGETVYMAARSPLTADEISDLAGLGGYMPAYTHWRGDIYLPEEPIETVAYTFGYTTFSPQQMQRSLFFDPNKTRYIEDRSGQVIYTDGKRGLQLESGDTWMVFTDPVPMQDGADNLADNVLAAVQFVNQHGGWDSRYRFVPGAVSSDGRNIVFQQYYERYPLISGGVRYGQIRLLMQQGTAVVYERSLLNLGERQKDIAVRWLPGGERLRATLETFSRLREISAVFPAQYVTLTEDRRLVMEPVWAVRYTDGTVQSVAKAVMDAAAAASADGGAETAGQPSGEHRAEDGANAENASEGEAADSVAVMRQADSADEAGEAEGAEAGAAEPAAGEEGAADDAAGATGEAEREGGTAEEEGEPSEPDVPQADAPLEAAG